MKKLLVFIMVSVFALGSVFAQQREPRKRATPEDMAKRQTEMLAKELKLTDEQKEKIYEINLKYTQPRKQEGDRTDREKRREEFRKFHQERTDSINSVLTDEQKKKFEEHQKKMQDRPRGHRNRR